MDHLFKVTFKHGCSQKDMYLQLIGQDISEVHPYLSRYYEHVTYVKITDLGHYNPITGLVTESQRIRYNGYVTSNKGEHMTTNIKHYNIENLSPELQKQVEDGKLTGPCFIGQGLSERVGSDCYGHYIVASKKVGSKTIWGIARAHQVMHGDWTEGDMDCSIDMSNAKPDSWITKYGKHWYFCDANGKRYAGRKCSYYWNGAYGYQDPSF